MNIENHLILIKNEDKTDQIIYCKYDNGKYQVTYNSGKTYSYNYNNVQWLKNPVFMHPENHVVYENAQPLSGVAKILGFNQYVRILFKSGYQKVYPAHSIKIEESCLKNKVTQNCFEYLKKLSGHVSVTTDEGVSLLNKQYDRISAISPRSVLAKYLSRSPLQKGNRFCNPIYPFGFNLSQKVAVEKALTEQISVIEGPPGTGKTQTILNIIANAMMDEKTVAVVSNNNSATSNVIEKLQRYGVDFIAAFLGNKENKEKFFEEQKAAYPDMGNWIMKPQDIQNMKTSLHASQQKLNEMLLLQNKQAALKQEFSGLQIEAEYFHRYYQESAIKSLDIPSFSRISADKILGFMLQYKRNLEKGFISFVTKLYNLFVYGITRFKLYKNDSDDVITFLQSCYYEKKVRELQNEIEALTKKLGDYHFDYAMREYGENSMRLFKAQLANQYKSNGRRPVYGKEVLWKNFDAFIKEYPVILSTTHSLRSCAGENYLFDFLIIDEASQVDLVSGALALSCAKNAVIVGDVKQLPNVVPNDIAEITKSIFHTYNLDNAYNYADHSLLSSITELYQDVPKTMLKEHYRCHPKIAGFCNQKFYNNALVILTREKDNDKPLVLYKTAKGHHARGRLNQRQIDVVFEEIIPQQKMNGMTQSVGIISPFRLQTDEIKKTIGERNIEADTVHKFQGREKDVIILTTVANEVLADDFVDNPNLINVAVSRAVNKLIVVVSEGSEGWKGTNLGDLVRYIQYNNFEIIESRIYSVFDLLYKSYSNKLLEVLKKNKKVSDYHSENLMNIVIEKVLSQQEFQCLDRVIHQPLRMLIRDLSLLNDNECKFVLNILTHTDFVIFSKLDKSPVLVVEVDGYSYHALNPKQLERDNMKDAILKKYSIPVFRIKTNESGEEEKLRCKLKEAMLCKML